MEHNDLPEKILLSFKKVQYALNTLCLHIHDELKHLPIWINDGNGKLIHDIDRTIYALKHFVYDSHITAQETFGCPGAIAITENTLNLLMDVNEFKNEFKSIVKKTRQQYPLVASKMIRDVLAQAGYGVVKLKEIYRHLHYITYHPRRISWSKARGGANVVISHEEAKKRLLDLGEGEHIDIQLAKLSLLSNSEKLVVHRDLRSYWIVNIAQFKTSFGTKYENIRTSLPIFYVHNSTLPDPLVLLREGKQRTSVRADKRIENDAFLSLISAYRYIR